MTPSDDSARSADRRQETPEEKDSARGADGREETAEEKDSARGADGREETAEEKDSARGAEGREETPEEKDSARGADGREETPEEKFDRNTIELLQELRVASTGIQFMFAFLLVVPFNNAFRKISSFEKTVYFITLLCVAISAVLLLAPSIHHRILFRQREKGYLVSVANRMAIWGMIFLAFGFTGILILLSDFVVGGVAPVVVGAAAALGIAGLWFVLPLSRRRR